MMLQITHLDKIYGGKITGLWKQKTIRHEMHMLSGASISGEWFCIH